MSTTETTFNFSHLVTHSCYERRMLFWSGKCKMVVLPELSVISLLILLTFLFIVSSINTSEVFAKNSFHSLLQTKPRAPLSHKRKDTVQKDTVEGMVSVRSNWSMNENDSATLSRRGSSLVSHLTQNVQSLGSVKYSEVNHRPNVEEHSSKKHHRIRHRRRHRHKKGSHKHKVGLKHVSDSEKLPASFDSDMRKASKRILQNHSTINPPNSPSLQNSIFKYPNNTKINRTCSKCGLPSARDDEGTVKRIRIQLFIQTLSDKLRTTPEELMSRRNSSLPPKLPREFLEQALQDSPHTVEDDQFYARDKRIILPGHDMGRNCIARRTSGCYKFTMSGKVKGDVVSAQLWVYKNADRHDHQPQTFLLYGLEKYDNGSVRAESLIQRHETDVRKGWVVIPVSSSWVHERRNRKAMIAIRCTTCATRNHKSLYGSKHRYKPLLVVENSMVHSRYIRDTSEDCDPTVTCCKRNLTVNFRRLNIDNVMPLELNLSYCYGSCEVISQYTYNHTKVKENYMKSVDNVNATLRSSLKMCCAPVHLQGKTMIIRSNATTVTEYYVPNLIVGKCGCI